MRKIVGSEKLDFIENIENIDHISTIANLQSIYIVFKNHEDILKIIFRNADETQKGYEKIKNFFNAKSNKTDSLLWFEDLHGMKDLLFI